MPPRKQLMDPNYLPGEIICVLKQHGNEMEENKLYRYINIPASESVTSTIVEHPSLHIKNGVIFFRPFWRTTCQDDVLNLLRVHFPRCLRKIDMAGLYDFIQEDTNELIFCGKCVEVDKTCHSLTVVPSPSQRFSAIMKELWINRMK